MDENVFLDAFLSSMSGRLSISMKKVTKAGTIPYSYSRPPETWRNIALRTTVCYNSIAERFSVRKRIVSRQAKAKEEIFDLLFDLFHANSVTTWSRWQKINMLCVQLPNIFSLCWKIRQTVPKRKMKEVDPGVGQADKKLAARRFQKKNHDLHSR